MSDELELLTKELDLSKEPEGLLVRANDGQSFFIPNADLKRFAVKDESVENLWSGKPDTGVAQPDLSPYCRMLSGWLLTHEPNTETWRKWATYR
jgi:hypothetical protein